MSLLTNEILLNIRKTHKLSRKGLENLSGFKERTIISYERGERQPSDNYIKFMGLYFNVNLDYIKGLIKNNQKMTTTKRTLLMYKDIYGYDDNKMIELMEVSQEEYLELMKDDKGSYSSPKEMTTEYKILILSISEKLNIRPSCLGFHRKNIIELQNLEDSIKYLEITETQAIEEKINKLKDKYEKHNNFAKPLNERLQNIENNGLNLDREYYAKAIKNRNLAKENYTPTNEHQKIDKRYQVILDLLPYASDTFLEDITTKLKAMKDIQKL